MSFIKDSAFATQMEKDESLIPYSREIKPSDISTPQSCFEVADSVLSQAMAKAKTSEERDKVLEQMDRLVKIDYRRSRLKHIKESANQQLEEEKKKKRFQRFQQSVASIASVSIGLYILPSLPMLSPFIILIGLTKPLGYSLTEVSSKFLKIGFNTSRKDND